MQSNHHHESKKGKSSEGNSGFIEPYGRYGNDGKTSKTISTIAILRPVKAIFEKRAAMVEVDTFISTDQAALWGIWHVGVIAANCGLVHQYASIFSIEFLALKGLPWSRQGVEGSSLLPSTVAVRDPCTA